MKTVTHYPAVGTADGLRLLGRAGPDPLAGTPITAVHADGTDIWVLAAQRDLHRLTGGTVEHVASLGGGASGICLTTHGGTVWVGGDSARLWRLDGDEFEEVRSFQEAPTQPDWHTPWGGPPDVFSMASDGTDLYVSVHVGGILGRPTARRGRRRSTCTTTSTKSPSAQPARCGRRLEPAVSARAATVAPPGATTPLACTRTTCSPSPPSAAVRSSARPQVTPGATARCTGSTATGSSVAVGCPTPRAVGPRHSPPTASTTVAALPDGAVYASHDGGFAVGSTGRGLAGLSELTRRRVVGRSRTLRRGSLGLTPVRSSGEQWRPGPVDLRGAVGPRQLVANGEHAVVALPGGDVYASHDGGFEWTSLARGLTGVSEVALVAT